MHIPSNIKIGGIRYTVKICGTEELGERIAGQIQTDKCLIRISKGDPQFMQVTFWHEVFHAMNMEFEEERIEFLAQAMNQIVSDNPKIFYQQKNECSKAKNIQK